MSAKPADAMAQPIEVYDGIEYPGVIGFNHGHGGSLICEDKHGHDSHHIMHTCHMLSIGILCIFLVELLLKYWVNPEEFCKCKLHILDLTVVVVSLVIDIYVSYLIETGGRQNGEQVVEAATISQLLLVLRFWRIVRIAHGFSEIRQIELEKQHHAIEHERAKYLKVIQKHGLEGEVEKDEEHH